jgi:hypothetical protein
MVATAFVLVASLLLALQVPRIGTGLANSVLRRISTVPGATLAVGEVRGNWLTRLELRDLRMVRGDTVLVAADTVRLGIRPWNLLAGRLDLGALEIVGPTVSSALASGRPDSGEGPSLSPAEILRGRFYTGPELRVERLDVRRERYGTTANPDAPGLRIDGVSLVARDLEMGDTLAVVIDSLALRYVSAAPGAGAVHLVLAATVAEGRLDVGRLSLHGPRSVVVGNANWAPDVRDSMTALEIELHADPLVLSDLALLSPGRESKGEITADVSLSGSRLDRLSGSARIRFTEARLREVHLGPTDFAADFTDGLAVIDASTTWEGARAEVHGWMRPLASTPDYDLVLQLDRLPARLPGTPWWEAFAGRGSAATRLHVSGRGYGNAALHASGSSMRLGPACTCRPRWGPSS